MRLGLLGFTTGPLSRPENRSRGLLWLVLLQSIQSSRKLAAVGV
jgi:hypothetical protein